MDGNRAWLSGKGRVQEKIKSNEKTMKELELQLDDMYEISGGGTYRAEYTTELENRLVSLKSQVNRLKNELDMANITIKKLNEKLEQQEIAESLKEKFRKPIRKNSPRPKEPPKLYSPLLDSQKRLLLTSENTIRSLEAECASLRVSSEFWRDEALQAKKSRLCVEHSLRHILSPARSPKRRIKKSRTPEPKFSSPHEDSTEQQNILERLKAKLTTKEQEISRLKKVTVHVKSDRDRNYREKEKIREMNLKLLSPYTTKLLDLEAKLSSIESKHQKNALHRHRSNPHVCSKHKTAN